MHAYRKCKRLLSQRTDFDLVWAWAWLCVSASNDDDDDDDTMADGSDKLKLFFARFSKGEGGTPRPPSFAQYAAYPIAELFFASFGFDLITAKCASTPLCTHTHTLSDCCVCVCIVVACRCIFQIFLCTVAHYAPPTLRPCLCPSLFHIFAFSHFYILGAAENSASLFEFFCEIFHASIQIFPCRKYFVF